MKWKAGLPALALLVTSAYAATVSYRDGTEVHSDSVSYQQEHLLLDTGTRVHRDRVKEILFEAPHAQASDSVHALGIPQDVEQILGRARMQAEKYPDADGIILLDDGTFVLNEDGTNAFRYHFQGLILKDEKKEEWGDHSLYFDEKRERVKLLWARTIRPTGEVVDLDPSTAAITDEPAEEVHFGAGKIFTFTLPEVEVGCVVEYAYQRDEFDPFDPRMFFPGFYFQSYEPVGASKLSVVVPATKKLNYKAYRMPGHAAQPDVTRDGETTKYVWELLDVPPLIPEPSMPPYSAVVPRVDASLFEDWDYIFDWMARMQRRRMEVTPEITEAVEDITAGAATLQEKIASLYYFVQQHIRYISVKGSIGSGWSGHEAFFTLQNKYGDCIDKSILLSTLLTVIGVESEPVVVMTNSEGEEDRAVPSMAGNHAISVVHLDGRDMYLDGTSFVHRYPSFRADDHGVTTINALRRTIGFVDVPPPEQNQRSYRLNVQVLPDGNAEVAYQSTYMGDYEARVRGTYMVGYKESEYARVLSDLVSGISPGAVLGDYALENVHDISRPFSIKMEYALNDYVVQAGSLRILGVPGIETQFPEAALPHRRYPITYETSYEKVQDATIVVPRSFRVKYVPQAIRLDTPYATYAAQYEVRDDTTIVFHDDFRRLEREVPVEAYAQYKAFLQQVSKYSKERMFFEVE